MEYPNISFLKKFDAITITGALDILAKNALWYFLNTRFPDMQGDPVGLEGFRLRKDHQSQISKMWVLVA